MVSVLPFKKNSAHLCQQLALSSFTISVWSSSRVSAGSSTLCSLHHYSVWHHLSTLCQPSPFLLMTLNFKIMPPLRKLMTSHSLQARTDDADDGQSTETEWRQDRSSAFFFSLLASRLGFLPDFHRCRLQWHSFFPSRKWHPTGDCTTNTDSWLQYVFNFDSKQSGAPGDGICLCLCFAALWAMVTMGIGPIKVHYYYYYYYYYYVCIFDSKHSGAPGHGIFFKFR